jgi:hypothetical protein
MEKYLLLIFKTFFAFFDDPGKNESDKYNYGWTLTTCSMHLQSQE